VVRHRHLRLHRQQRGHENRPEQQQGHERAAMARAEAPPCQSPHEQAVIMLESSDTSCVRARALPLSDSARIS